MNGYLLNGVHSLIKNVLHLEDLSKATLSEKTYLFEESVVSILLEILLKLVVACELDVAVDKLLMEVLADRMVLIDFDIGNEILVSWSW